MPAKPGQPAAAVKIEYVWECPLCLCLFERAGMEHEPCWSYVPVTDPFDWPDEPDDWREAFRQAAG